jgi:hypothetical protein
MTTITTRLGRFRISNSLLATMDKEALQTLLAGAIVLEKCPDFAMTTFKCIHPAFDLIGEAVMNPPFYVPTITMQGGTLAVRWEKEGTYDYGGYCG